MNPIGYKVTEEREIKALFWLSMQRDRVEHIYVCGLNENIVKYYKDVSIRTGNKKSDKKNAWTDLIKVSRELKDSKCTSFYVAHNHLNEYPFPSSDDVKFTENFKNIACKYDVNLVQHWVVSKFDGKPMLWNIIEDK